jgi:hypothetical protein
LAQSYDFGKTWDVYENIPGAQYYAIGVDMDEPYNIYGGTQDTGSFRIPSNSVYGSITRNDWAVVGGGDGMYNQVDPNDSRWLYNDYQMGAIQRFNQKLGVGTSSRAEAKVSRLTGSTGPPRFTSLRTTARLSIWVPKFCCGLSTGGTIGRRSARI